MCGFCPSPATRSLLASLSFVFAYVLSSIFRIIFLSFFLYFFRPDFFSPINRMCIYVIFVPWCICVCVFFPLNCLFHSSIFGTTNVRDSPRETSSVITNKNTENYNATTAGGFVHAVPTVMGVKRAKYMQDIHSTPVYA